MADVPSMSYEPQTEEKVMRGSVADVSTEAGRQLMQEIDFGMQSAATGGLMEEASDRLYLKEQAMIEDKNLKEIEKSQEVALEEFRRRNAETSDNAASSSLPTILTLPKKNVEKHKINIVAKKKKQKLGVNVKKTVVKTSSNALKLVHYSSSDSEK